MQIRDYVEALVQAERNALISDIVIDGVDIWPLYRAQTISMFRNPSSYHKHFESHKIVSPRLRERVIEAIGKFKLEKLIEQEAEHMASELGNVRVLFYSRNSNYTDRAGSFYIDRFCDPYIDYLKAKGISCGKIELSGTYEPAKERMIKPVVIDESHFRKYWYLSSGRKRSLISGVDKMQSHVNAAAGLNFVTRHIQSGILEVWYYKLLFTALFEKLKPEYVFYKCYYEHDAAGLTLAAHDAGIKTVDIQHGKQGEFHPMYSHFTRIPQGGYKLLPDYFWNWGNTSALNISESRGSVSAFHTPLVGGNLWMAQWKSLIPSSFINNLAKVPESWERASKCILFTLQPLDREEIIPEAVKSAIRNSPDDWMWLIRRHPMQRISNEEILDLLDLADNSRVNIEEASILPLFQVLRYTDHHITQWSSVVFEAEDFGVQSTITGLKGASIYEKYIKEGSFGYAETSTQILNSITGFKDGNKRISYIESSESVIRNAFKKLNILTSAD